eukprot:g2087.t1
MPVDEKKKLDGRIYSFDHHKEKKPVSKSKCGRKYENLHDKQEGLETLTKSSEEGVRSNRQHYEPVYLTELRYTKQAKYRHPVDGKWSRTAMTRSVQDYLGSEGKFMPYWDRYNEVACRVPTQARCATTLFHGDSEKSEVGKRGLKGREVGREKGTG